MNEFENRVLAYTSIVLGIIYMAVGLLFAQIVAYSVTMILLGVLFLVIAPSFGCEANRIKWKMVKTRGANSDDS